MKRWYKRNKRWIKPAKAWAGIFVAVAAIFLVLSTILSPVYAGIGVVWLITISAILRLEAGKSG